MGFSLCYMGETPCSLYSPFVIVDFNGLHVDAVLSGEQRISCVLMCLLLLDFSMYLLLIIA